MEIGSKEWKDVIEKGGRSLGLEPTPLMLGRFADHARELLAWNRKINLTAITDPEAVAVKHFVDALAPVKWIPQKSRVLDIGSGAGFPGIPIQVVRQDLSLTLVDAVRKKASFVQHVVRTLGLESTIALHIRAQDLAREPAMIGSFDVVVCRAFSDLASFLELARPLVAAGGIAIAMKGRLDPQELAEAKKAVPGGADLPEADWRPAQVEIERYRLPVFDAQRSLVRFG